MSYFLVDRLLKTKVRYPAMVYEETELIIIVSIDQTVRSNFQNPLSYVQRK